MAARLISFIFCLVYFGAIGYAQQPDLEEFLEQSEEYSDLSDLMEMLSEFEKHPLKLNQATSEQLAVLPWISDILAAKIIEYRKQIGGFHSFDELAQVPDFIPELIPILQKYIVISSKSHADKFSLTTKTRVTGKLEENKGIRTGAYYPSPAKIYNRYGLSYGNLFYLGTILEKDSGERRFDDLKLYFFKYDDPARGNKFLLGNYRLEFAQGLVFGNPYSYGKSAAPLFPAKRRSRDLLEYTLVDENASLYGIAGQLSFKFYQIFIFYSAHKLDASLNADGTAKNFFLTGYHRNAGEGSKKDQLTEKLAGTRFCFQPAANYSLGVTYYQSAFNRTFVPESEALNRYSFEGRGNLILGFDYRVILGRFNLFGETASSKNHGYGLLTGVMMNAAPIDLAIIARKYTKDFISFHGKSFGETSDHPQNEEGIYFAVQLNPLKNVKLAFYLDQFRFPWATYFIPMPSKGQDLLFRIEHKPIKNLSYYCQLKTTMKDNSVPSFDEMKREFNSIIPRHQFNARLQVEYQPWNFLAIRQRIEKIWINYQRYNDIFSFQKNRFQGILMYHDLSLRLNSSLLINTRLTFFDTDSYESRLYQIEHDVPQMLSNQMLYGVGNRWYINFQWKLKSFLVCSIKFSSTRYFHQTSIGSGADMILGDTARAVNCQLESNF